MTDLDTTPRSVDAPGPDVSSHPADKTAPHGAAAGDVVSSTAAPLPGVGLDLSLTRTADVLFESA